MNLREEYKESIAEALGMTSGQVSLFWKGRVGLYGLLLQLEIGEGDEVILPAFTCVVVANAVFYVGAHPVYVDIIPETYNMDPTKVEQAISSKTKLIIAQNTFGLAPDMDQLLQIAFRHKVKLIEDCTHGFGGSYKGRPNGTLADAAFFSTQWNKPFSTGLGGIVLCKDKELAKKMSNWESSLPQPPHLKSASLRLQLWARDHLMGDGLYWMLLRWYRKFSRWGWLSGSSEGVELEGIEMPSDFAMGMSKLQMRRGLRELARIQENLAHRQKLAGIYAAALSAIGVDPVTIPGERQHTFLKYPLLVKDRSAFMDLAEANKIPLGDWMLSPIHPIQEGLEKWAYRYGENPQAEKQSRHIVNLPTDLGISEKTANRIAVFLERNSNHLV